MKFDLQTDRLLLRPFEPGDKAPLLAYYSESESWPMILAHQADPNRMSAVLDRMIADTELLVSHGFAPTGFVVVERASGLVIGTCGASEKLAGDATLGWHFGIAHAGKGYATEAAEAVANHAFTTLGLTSLYADCFHDNAATRRILEKLGMRRLWRDRLFEFTLRMAYGEKRKIVRFRLPRALWTEMRSRDDRSQSKEGLADLVDQS